MHATEDEPSPRDVLALPHDPAALAWRRERLEARAATLRERHGESPAGWPPAEWVAFLLESTALAEAVTANSRRAVEVMVAIDPTVREAVEAVDALRARHASAEECRRADAEAVELMERLAPRSFIVSPG